MADRRALVITTPGSIGLQDAPELVPGPGEVVARPVHTGICGTDLELLAGVVDPAYVCYPLVPGHEWSGVIEAVGPGVAGLEPGQQVIAEGIIPDRVCAQWGAGRRGRRRHAGPDHRAPAPALLARRADRLRPAPDRFPLEAYDQAYQVLRAGPKDSGPRGKVMLDVTTETTEAPEIPGGAP